MRGITAVQETLIKEYLRKGYYCFKPEVAQSRGEIIMRKDNPSGSFLRTIFPNGRTKIRILRKRP